MPGEVIELDGGARELVIAVVRMREAGFDFALVGGLAVMLRLAEAHRVTLDLDGVFDNITDTPTTEQLVLAGVATDDDAPQRVLVAGTKVDVIDTYELPADLEAFPDNAKDRLFVCAHRYAFDTAAPLLVSAEDQTTDVAVATVPAIVATKAHALRFATNQRRAMKRTSDLFDLYRLAAVSTDEIIDGLGAAPWDLQAQVSHALHADLHNLEQDAALLRSVRAGGTVDHDDYIDVIDELLARLPISD